MLGTLANNYNNELFLRVYFLLALQLPDGLFLLFGSLRSELKRKRTLI